MNDDLTESIARALYGEAYTEGRYPGDWRDENPAIREHFLARAAAVLPAVRAAQADALREAKGRVYASAWWADGGDNLADRVRGFLSQCADEIETED